MHSHNTLKRSTQMPQDIQWMMAINHLLLGLFFLTLLTIGVVWMSQRPFFNIATIKINGDLLRNNMATIHANVSPHFNGKQANFFTLDLAKSRAAFENLSWVRQALVRKVWPNTVHVTLFEHQPIAFWQASGRDDLLVNEQGEVFEANTGDVDDDALPIFKAPIASTPEHAQSMLSMYQSLAPVARALPASIHILHLNDRGSWSIKLDNDALIELGRGQPEAVVSRATRFVKTIQKIQHSNGEDFTFADLRYPNGYAVRFRDLPTLAAVSDAYAENSPTIPLNSPKPQ